MRAGAGVALRGLQMFVRGVQFCCSALILALYSYFLATLHNHGLSIATWIRAVEGISGVAVLYTSLGVLLVCCLAGHPFTSGVAVVLDIAFVAAFIYVASANRGGAGSCNGVVSTPFGTGSADTKVVDDGHGGFTTLPSFGQACRMESACLAVAILAIFFFVFSAIIEIFLVRHRRVENIIGPSPDNDYTSGYGKRQKSTRSKAGSSMFSWLRGRRGRGTAVSNNPNALPEHTHPDQVRESYATEQTRLGTSSDAPGGRSTFSDTVGYGARHHDTLYKDTAQPAHQPARTHAAFPPANYSYEDGVYSAVS